MFWNGFMATNVQITLFGRKPWQKHANTKKNGFKGFCGKEHVGNGAIVVWTVLLGVVVVAI